MKVIKLSARVRESAMALWALPALTFYYTAAIHGRDRTVRLDAGTRAADIVTFAVRLRPIWLRVR